jgi:hypothetical protein
MAERSFLSSIELSSEGELGEDGMGMLRGSSCCGFVKALEAACSWSPFFWNLNLKELRRFVLFSLLGQSFSKRYRFVMVLILSGLIGILAW